MSIMTSTRPIMILLSFVLTIAVTRAAKSVATTTEIPGKSDIHDIASYEQICSTWNPIFFWVADACNKDIT